MSVLNQSTINSVRALAVSLADLDAGVLASIAPQFAELYETIGCKADYDQLRENFIEAYMGRQGCTEKSAANRWTELRELIGGRKPQSDAAARKQELRKAKASADKADQGGDTTPPTPANADESATKVLKLTAMEVHLVSMIRAGKFAQVHEALRDMESAA